MRRMGIILGSVVAATGAVPATAGAGAGAAGATTVPVLVIDGRGFGHGVGMAQDGAYWMGRLGATTPQILGHFYPGTALARATGAVRVAVHTAPGGTTTIAFPAGGELREVGTGAASPGFPVKVPPGGEARVRADGDRLVVDSPAPAGGGFVGQGGPAPAPAPGPTDAASTTTTTAPPRSAVPPLGSPSTTIVPHPTTTTSTTMARAGGQPPRQAPGPPTSARPLRALTREDATLGVPARGRRYRGVLDLAAAAGGLRVVNQLDVEQYLRGMGEVRNPGWPSAALRAQAVAARTYAMRAMAAAGELCDSQRCQVYLGAGAEYEAMDAAVRDSAGQVLVYGRGLASTVYSANGGGHSATREEGFGTSGGAYPYLRAAPYETRDPVPWTVRVSLADVAARLGYPGVLERVAVVRRGPSGRALQLLLDGSAGGRAITGLAADAALGLRSTLFTLRTELAEAPPPPPPSHAGIQAPPEAVGAAMTALTTAPVPTRVGRSTGAAAPAARRALPSHPVPRAAPLLGAAVAVWAGLVVGRGRHRRGYV